ncbi:MAG: glycosyltransferase [Telluria sp.]|nr:glycosyltransferase [Telluria sp.]
MNLLATDCRIGVVIPTRGRAQLALRAVRSVLAQSHADLELVVVVDGPDEVTLAALAAVDDPRLRVESVSQRGAAAARNTGFDLISANWIAFLDDDDTWCAEKLEVQLSLALNCGVTLPVVACRTLKVTRKGGSPYPARMPRPNEPVSEFLFAPGWRLARGGGAQTSTLLVPREVFEQVRFDEALPRHQDWDWLLRAVQLPGVELVVAPQILAEWDQYSAPQRISGPYDWRYSFDWIRQRYGLVTGRAYAGFLLTVIPVSAARGGSSAKVFLQLFKEAWRGRPDPMQLLIFMGWWLLPDKLIRWVGCVSK